MKFSQVEDSFKQNNEAIKLKTRENKVLGKKFEFFSKLKKADKDEDRDFASTLKLKRKEMSRYVLTFTVNKG